MRLGKEKVHEPASGPLVVFLDRLAIADRAWAGGKAVNLGAMIRAGLPVPRGFCIMAAAYQLWFDTGEIAKPSFDRLDALDATQTKEIQETVAEVRGKLATAPIPESVERAIEAACEQHEPTAIWAVRSSASLEDLPDASFAGQHDTFLNVCGREALLNAVRECWISLFTERAVFYRITKRIPHRLAAMAVVAQEMVPAQAAGVLFTIDPVTGRTRRIVIEGVRGLGEAVVSGRANPERVMLDKDTLRVVKQPAGQKMAECGSVQSVGAGTQDMAGAKPPESCLDPALARRLGKLARKVERLFGGPQDIEWAVTGDQIFLLQARPVTPTRPARSWEDRQVWINLNTGEVFPDVMTPISWSMLQLFITPLFRSIFRLFGADVAKGSTTGLVAGRIYFNVNTGLAALKPFSFAMRRAPNVSQALGGGHLEESQRALTDIHDEELPDLGFRWSHYILSWPRILFDLITHSFGCGEAFLARMKARGEHLARVDFTSLPTPDLARAIPKAARENLADWDLLYLFMRAGVLLVFQKACREWLEDPALSLAYRLFAGLGGIPEAEAGLALWRLAALAHAGQETEAALLAQSNWPAVRAALDHSVPGREFLTAWDAFMREHGHHCRGELELFNARWAETPDYILGLVQGYVRSMGQSNPVANQRRLAQERLQLTEQCRRRLKNPFKRAIFSWSLRRAQQLAIDREEWKNQAVRQIAALRRSLLVLGERLEQQGILAQREDVFFLELSEIEPVGTGQACFEIQPVIVKRRADYERNRAMSPPPLVVGSYDPQVHTAPPPDANATVLTGIPVFPGVVTGLAKVILRADDHEQVFPGEILVAPFTDPAWTPYFVSAAGVVMDQGGILSHGSIVAREYGLPAVTNVGSATRIIHTGDQVRVDGTRGCLTILARRASEALDCKETRG